MPVGSALVYHGGCYVENLTSSFAYESTCRLCNWAIIGDNPPAECQACNCTARSVATKHEGHTFATANMLYSKKKARSCRWRRTQRQAAARQPAAQVLQAVRQRQSAHRKHGLPGRGPALAVSVVSLNDVRVQHQRNRARALHCRVCTPALSISQVDLGAREPGRLSGAGLLPWASLHTKQCTTPAQRGHSPCFLSRCCSVDVRCASGDKGLGNRVLKHALLHNFCSSDVRPLSAWGSYQGFPAPRRRAGSQLSIKRPLFLRPARHLYCAASLQVGTQSLRCSAASAPTSNAFGFAALLLAFTR